MAEGRPGVRVENLGANIVETLEKSGNGSSTYDVCEFCYGELERDPHCFNADLTPYNGEEQGKDGWGGDVAHPLYDNVWPPYICAVCGATLIDHEEN